MPALPFPEALRTLLLGPNPAVIAYNGSDGHPLSVATWYLLEDDDRVLINMDNTRARLKHLRADPRVSLTVLDAANWYTHVSVIGTVVDLSPDTGLRDINRLSRHYVQSDYHDQQSPRVSGWIQVHRWHGWRSSRPIHG